MSSLASAGRVVARARRRLAVAAAAERAATGALVGASAAVIGVALQRMTSLDAPAVLWLLLPVLGVLSGLAAGLLRPPAPACAALAVDRAAGTHEAFVSALTAHDADPGFRELAAAYGLRILADRPLQRLLPLAVPRRTAPALAGVALLAALLVAGATGDAAAAPRADARGLPGSGGNAAAVGDTAPGPGAVPSRDPGRQATGDTAAAGRLPGASDEDVAQLARDLAERGVEAAQRALEALARGDRAGAEALLREALTAPGTGSGGGSGGGTQAAAGSSASSTAPGVWSAGAWPLRYDREVRAWLRRQAAADGPGTEER